MTPGSDLLADALQNIDTYPINVYPYIGRVTNSIGILVPSWAEEPTVYQGSAQAVSRSMYVQLGLDFNKKYIQCYLSANVGTLDRDITGDKVIVGSKTYEIIGDLDWFEFDGWKAILCVQLKLPATVGA